ncbi:hypothetical protein NEOLEDRAFT_946124 [Neolentinus lepideus HHB14362 ss-1]|uniref:Uncharacterized protein n=1 Tax=Neolentinus lepideus HHB14362 ss-1 TaxID=1314782 RepID=A0A165NEM0_9AGAM|nr:hypothetical protein NEOLEDRAFT_946124 [Neolentinus lepideus HHB14362 ss-1]
MHSVILDDYEHHVHACRICNTSGRPLWGPSNWQFLTGYISPDTLSQHFTGRLRRNHYETQRLFSYTIRPNVSYVPLMNWMFDNEMDSVIYLGLSRDDWQCRTCILAFIGSKLHLWWLSRSVQRVSMLLLKTAVSAIIASSRFFAILMLPDSTIYAHPLPLNRWTECLTAVCSRYEHVSPISRHAGLSGW